jgi:hypothetical protein
MEEPSFFAIFLATDAHVAKFAASEMTDPSVRGNIAPIGLFHPRYWIPSFDAHSRSSSKFYDCDKDVITSSIHFAKLGRPGWVERGKDISYMKLLDFALAKLNAAQPPGP